MKVIDSANKDRVESPILMGILLSHLFHLLSVIALYSSADLLCHQRGGRTSPTAFLAAVLHVLSPAGIFLSAPYAEPLCSFLTFVGYWLYIKASLRSQTNTSSLSNVLILVAGCAFGLATSVRSNGLFNGFVFLIDALSMLPNLLEGITVSKVARLFCLGLAGITTLLGAFIPQLFAYGIYCKYGSDNRPWCNNYVPSIYSWVQSHYW